MRSIKAKWHICCWLGWGTLLWETCLLLSYSPEQCASKWHKRNEKNKKKNPSEVDIHHRSLQPRCISIHIWAFQFTATPPHAEMQNSTRLLVCLTVTALWTRGSIHLPRASLLRYCASSIAQSLMHGDEAIWGPNISLPAAAVVCNQCNSSHAQMAARHYAQFLLFSANESVLNFFMRCRGQLITGARLNLVCIICIHIHVLKSRGGSWSSQLRGGTH